MREINTLAIVIILLLSLTAVSIAAERRPTQTRPEAKQNHAVVAPANPEALQTQDLSSGLTLQDIMAALVGVPSIAITNVHFTGSDSALGTFTGGDGIIGFDQGIVLSSGEVAGVVGPNSAGSYTTSYGRPGDADLDSLIQGTELTEDASVLEFDFECPAVREIGFEYVFSSEEYNEYVNASFNDVFGFFVNGENVALLPDGQTIVSINNVNGGNPFGDTSTASNSQYYRNNDGCQFSTVPNCPFNTEMDGLTVVLIAKARINPGVNHIKLAVADVSDDAYDSNVFLKGQSFVCGAVNNNAPICVIDPPGPFNVNVGNNVTFSVTGTDPDDGQSIYLYALGDPPSGSSMNPTLPRAGSRTGLTSRFSWTPTQAGNYSASFLLTDSLGGSDTATAQIVVNATQVNVSPVCVIDPPGPFTVNAGKISTFTVSATDANSGQTIRLSTFGQVLLGETMNPPVPIFGPWTGVSSQFSWMPTQLGSFLVRFSASDSSGGFDSISVRIDVLEGIAPRVVLTSPVSSEADVSWFRGVNIDFSEPLLFSSIGTSEISAMSARYGALAITPGFSQAVPRISISYGDSGWPDDDSITIHISGSVKDLAGNTLDGNGNGVSEGAPIDDYVFSFSTAPGVYPGDANDDGIVDERDILPIGVHFLRTGSPRHHNAENWSLEVAAAWTPRAATHADCDGNGVIDSNDVCLILEFFDNEISAKRSTENTDLDVLSVTDGNVRAALLRAIVSCNFGSSAARARLLNALESPADATTLLPGTFELAQNYPNPFNAGTVISWELGQSGQVELEIYDVLGRSVRNLIDADYPPGHHQINWDGRDNNGATVASGVYFYQIVVNKESKARRMVLIR